MKFFSRVILLIVAISSSLRAVPMLTDGEERAEGKKKSSDEVTAVARRTEEAAEKEGNEEQRAIGISAKDSTLSSASSQGESPVSSSPRMIDLSQLIIPRSFTSYERRQFQQDLQEVKKIAASIDTAPSMKRVRGLIRYWTTKDVKMDPRYVQAATTCLKAAEEHTETANQLKNQAEDSFYETLEARKNYYSAIHACERMIKLALQTAQAWKETAIIYERMPAPHWGVEGKEKWAREANQWKLNRREVLIELLSRAEEHSDHTRQTIDKMRDGYGTLRSRGSDDHALTLSDACEKVIAAQRAVMLAKENLQKISAESNFPVDRNIILSLEMALNAAISTGCEAEHVYDEVLLHERTERELTESERQNVDEFCAVINKWFERSPSFGEIEKSNGLFEEHSKVLDDYAQNTLAVAQGALSFFANDGEFGDPADSNNLSNALDVVKAMRIVLNVFQKESTNTDPWLQAKQALAISNLEQAVEQVHEIAQRLRSEDKYEQDHNMDTILAHLQQLKEEYAINVAAIQKE